MKHRLFMTFFLMTLTVFLVGMIVTSVVLYRVSFVEKREELRTAAGYLAALVEQSGAEALPQQTYDTKESGHFRVTLLSAEGDVLYDSLREETVTESHADREEFKKAVKDGEADIIRYSNHQNEPVYYYARRLADGRVLRLASAAATRERMIISMLVPAVGLVAVVFFLSFFIANRASESIVDPINRLDVSLPLERDTYPELAPLVQKINAQNKELYGKMTELREEHEKQDRMRREFTANVSHELKTPLTSISGYAEIIRDGIAQKEDVQRFAGKIYDEANRLVVLVGDILRLSRIEDRDVAAVWEDIELLELAKETAELLMEPASRQNVTVTVTGTETHINGVEQIVSEIVYNLIDNAVKYNTGGGSVTVYAGTDDEGAVLSVSDTGIGIPKADLPRIFERFYRVDKSHSKEVGGTGLGLSIVKHGASYHGASVQVKSEVGKGTEITVHFPKDGSGAGSAEERSFT